MGCPTVAARVGGIAEIVRDQQTGLLFRPEDPVDLAAKIVGLLTEPARAIDMGRRAGEDCEQRFHPLVIANRFADFFKDVIQRRAREHKQVRRGRLLI